MIPAWIHPPISHQMAFKAKMQPPSSFNAPSISGGSPIHERIQPKKIGSQVHTAVRSPGAAGTSLDASDASRDQAFADKLSGMTGM